MLDDRPPRGNDLLMRKNKVSTESAEASGGNITLTAPNLIHLMDSTLTSSVQGQAGSNGGNITIDPQFVVIQNDQLLATANAGAGGNITIAATGAVLVDRIRCCLPRADQRRQPRSVISCPFSGPRHPRSTESIL